MGVKTAAVLLFEREKDSKNGSSICNNIIQSHREKSKNNIWFNNTYLAKLFQSWTNGKIELIKVLAIHILETIPNGTMFRRASGILSHLSIFQLILDWRVMLAMACLEQLQMRNSFSCHILEHTRRKAFIAGSFFVHFFVNSGAEKTQKLSRKLSTSEARSKFQVIFHRLCY